MKIVALMCVRNEASYLPTCLAHLAANGVETIVIDNGSTDASRDIAESFVGSGVLRVVDVPYEGAFHLQKLLRVEEAIAAETQADWFMHQDADEIRQAPVHGQTLHEAVVDADQAGYNAINFDEFVFIPTAECPATAAVDYVTANRYYYFFEPKPVRQVKLWKSGASVVDLASSGGHSAKFPGRQLHPISFVMRHYIALSLSHLVHKYTRDRQYTTYEVENLGWHGRRATAQESSLRLPRRDEVKYYNEGATFDRSDPKKAHLIFS